MVYGLRNSVGNCVRLTMKNLFDSFWIETVLIEIYSGTGKTGDLLWY